MGGERAILQGRELVPSRTCPCSTDPSAYKEKDTCNKELYEQVFYFYSCEDGLIPLRSYPEEVDWVPTTTTQLCAVGVWLHLASLVIA